jgi:glycosyltransferase involved in cell wall biosynthesis
MQDHSARDGGAVATCELPGPTGTVNEAAARARLGEFTRALSEQLRQDSFDVVHTHGWLTGIAGQLARPDRGTALVHTFEHLRLVDGRDPVTGKAANRHRLRAERAVAACAHHVIVTHDTHREALLRAGVSPELVSVVPPAVQVPSRPNTAPRRHPVGPATVPPRRVLIVGVTCGRTARLGELAVLLSHAPGITVTVCDTRADPLGPQTPQLTAPGVDPCRAPLLARAHTAAARAQLLAATDLVISGEQAGLAHLEAMAASLPLVAASLEVAEAVVDGTTGVRAVRTPVSELAVAVRKLLDDPTRRQSMGSAARKRALTRHDWRQIADATVRAYHRHREPLPTSERTSEPATPAPRRAARGGR